VTTLSNLLRMLYSGARDYPRGQPLLYAESFSPNTPEGVCPKCHGIGRLHEVTEKTMVPNDPIDPNRSLYWSAVINGVVSVPVIMIWLVAAPGVMGDFVITDGPKCSAGSPPLSWRSQSRPCSPPRERGVSLCRSSWNLGEKKRFVRTHRRRTP
jgi:hypothetical protein